MLATALTRMLTDDATISAVCVGSGSDEFVRSLAATSPTHPRTHPRYRPRVGARGGTDPERVRSAPATVSRRRHDTTDIGHGRPHQRACDRDHDRSPDRARVGRYRGRRAGRCARQRVRSWPPRAACSPKTTTGRRSPRAARRSIASALRCPTRFAHFEERSKARPHERRPPDDRHHDAQSPRGAPALSSLACCRRAPLARSARVRRCLVTTPVSGQIGAWDVPGARPRPARRQCARRCRRAQPAGARVVGAVRLPDGRRRGIPRRRIDRARAEAARRGSSDWRDRVRAMRPRRGRGGTKGCSLAAAPSRAMSPRSSALATSSAARPSRPSAAIGNRS